MNIIKKKIIYCTTVVIAGIILIGTAYLKQDFTTMLGIGVGMTAVGLLKAIQFIRISHNPDKMKKYEMMQKEERLIMIVTKSGYLTFIISICAEYIAMLVLVLSNQEQLAFIFCTIASLQTLCYLILYFVFNRKY